MAYVKSTDLKNVQKDVLTSLISQNELINKSYQLKTTSQGVLKAVNELKTQLAAAQELAATANNSVAENNKKDVVFVIPKASNNAKSAEIYFPYIGNLKQIIANVGSLNDRTSNDAAVYLELQVLKDGSWETVVAVTVAKNSYYNKVIFNDQTTVHINAVPLRIKVVGTPENTTDISVVATINIKN